MNIDEACCRHSGCMGAAFTEERDQIAAQRDHWIRLFNRLEGAVAHHRKAMTDKSTLYHDEALYAAHDRVLKEATKGA